MKGLPTLRSPHDWCISALVGCACRRLHGLGVWGARARGLVHGILMNAQIVARRRGERPVGKCLSLISLFPAGHRDRTHPGMEQLEGPMLGIWLSFVGVSASGIVNMVAADRTLETSGVWRR